jgi:ribosomal protein L31
MRAVAAALVPAIVAAPVAARQDQEPGAERAGVVAAALDYMEGALTADAERMARGVHPDLSKVVIGTSPASGNQFLSYSTATGLVEWVRGAADQMAGRDKHVDVTVFDIGNGLATARAVGEMWYDFLQLAKMDGQWRIVNVLWSPNRLEAEDQTGVAPGPDDRAQVEATALDYIEGAFSGDCDRMASALHPELNKMLLATHPQTGRQFLSAMGASRLMESTRDGRGLVDEDERDIHVEIQDISHGMAAVKVTSSRYIDHLQVGKVDGEWMIINVLWVMNPDAPRPGR